MPRKNRTDGIRTAEMCDSLLHGSCRVACLDKVIINELCCDFRIGLRHEIIAFSDQKILDFMIVLDDAVMHDIHARRTVRMRVDIARLAVRRPARMADAAMPFEFVRKMV